MATNYGMKITKMERNLNKNDRKGQFSSFMKQMSYRLVSQQHFLLYPDRNKSVAARVRRAGHGVDFGFDPHTSHSDHTINAEVILRESVQL